MATVRKSQARLDHEKDLKVLAEMLEKAADDYDLCDEFYEVIDTINKKLKVPLPIHGKKLYGDVSLALSIAVNEVNAKDDDSDKRMVGRILADAIAEVVARNTSEVEAIFNASFKRQTGRAADIDLAEAYVESQDEYDLSPL